MCTPLRRPQSKSGVEYQSIGFQSNIQAIRQEWYAEIASRPPSKKQKCKKQSANKKM